MSAMEVKVGNFYKVWLPDISDLNIILVLETDNYGGCHVLSKSGKTFFLEDTNEVKPVSPNEIPYTMKCVADALRTGGKSAAKEAIRAYNTELKRQEEFSRKRKLRVNGRSYNQIDLDGIGKSVCKKADVDFKYASVDGHNKGLLVVGVKNGAEVKKMIYFHELKSFSLASRVNEQPYFENTFYTFYRDELEEAANYFASERYSKLVKFNISHKNDTLVVYGKVRIMPDKFEVSLYNVDRYLMGCNMFG